LPRWFEQTPAIASSLLPSEVGNVLELDELWSFVGSKEQERWLMDSIALILFLRQQWLNFCLLLIG
jgi:hypothetical protein